MTTNINNELLKMTKDIAKELTQLYHADPTDEERDEAEENGEALDLWDYFADVLDINYILDAQKELRGVRVAVTLGGPNIWIDTVQGIIEGFWGTEHAESWIASEVCEAINDIFDEIF